MHVLGRTPAAAALWQEELGQKSKCADELLPPEHYILNPADQSVDKSACRPGAASGLCITAKAAQEKLQVSSGSGSFHGASEDSPLPKKGREKLSSLLADLLGFPGTDRQPEAKIEKTRPNLYESMSPAFGNELKPAPSGGCVQDPQQKGRDVIYENCLKCRRERCHPPPRVAPAQRFPFGSVPTFQSSPSGLHLKRSHEREAAVHETPLHQGHGDGSGSVDGLCDYQEMNGRSVAPEGKRPLYQFPLQLITKRLRFLWRPFPLGSLWRVSSFFFLFFLLFVINKNTLLFLSFLFNKLLVSPLWILFVLLLLGGSENKV